MADYYGMDLPRGVLIAQVNPDTPAEAAGLENGDIILTVDDVEIRNPSMLRNVISLSQIGETVDLNIVRDGKEKTVPVKLGVLPDQVAAVTEEPENDEDETLDGVTVRALDDRSRSMAGLPDDVGGILVISVANTSNAAREGLAEGDVIQEVGGEKVMSLREFQSQLGENADRPVFMRVYKPRQQSSIFIAVPR
jgi:serine protease Do